MLYRTTNNRQNFDKLGIIFILLIPTVVWFFISDYDLIWFVGVVAIETVIVLGLSIWYRKSAFELTFTTDKIIYHQKFSSKKTDFSYRDLTQVHFNESISPSIPSSNIFVFKKGSSIVKLRTDIVETGEAFVNFIKFLKTKNTDFETYVKPKGTKLHSRLRQEILKTEF